MRTIDKMNDIRNIIDVKNYKETLRLDMTFKDTTLAMYVYH